MVVRAASLRIADTRHRRARTAHVGHGRGGASAAGHAGDRDARAAKAHRGVRTARRGTREPWDRRNGGVRHAHRRTARHGCGACRASGANDARVRTRCTCRSACSGCRRASTGRSGNAGSSRRGKACEARSASCTLIAAVVAAATSSDGDGRAEHPNRNESKLAVHFRDLAPVKTRPVPRCAPAFRRCGFNATGRARREGPNRCFVRPRPLRSSFIHGAQPPRGTPLDASHRVPRGVGRSSIRCVGESIRRNEIFRTTPHASTIGSSFATSRTCAASERERNARRGHLDRRYSPLHGGIEPPDGLESAQHVRRK